MMRTHAHPTRAPGRATLLCLTVAILAACSREPAPASSAAPSPADRPASAAASPAPAVAAPAARMDCMGADGVRFALDYKGESPSAFEYASSNPADRSIVCRYVAAEGDATSSWQRAADGSFTVTVDDSGPAGAAKFLLVPNAQGWRVQIVSQPRAGSACESAQPPNLLVLSGRPGEACSLTAQGGIAAFSKQADQRQQAFCAPERIDVAQAQAPAPTQDIASLFRQLPPGIVAMDAGQRERVLATGNPRLTALDPKAGFLSIERETQGDVTSAGASGFVAGTFTDNKGRAIVALIEDSILDVDQGIWRADERGWAKVGCELIDDYKVDHQYFPVAEGRALDVYDDTGKIIARLNWNGERFVKS